VLAIHQEPSCARAWVAAANAVVTAGDPKRTTPPVGRRGSGLMATVGAEGKGEGPASLGPGTRGAWATRPLYQYQRDLAPISNTESSRPLRTAN